MKLFALNDSRPFGQAVAEALGEALATHEEREFEDGEHKARPLESVRGQNAVVIQSLYGDARRSINDKLCRLLFFCGALRDAAAHRVIAVVPYLAYARKDSRTKARDPVTTRYLAQLFEVVGIDHVLTLDVHNPAAYQNAFRIVADHLEARTLLAAHFAVRLAGRPIVVASPDVGGIKRATAFAETLAALLGEPVGCAFMEKARSEGVVSGETLVGEVRGRTVLLVDDMICTGTTLLRAARACREQGAAAVHAAASHGVFVGDAGTLLADPVLDSVAVTDSLPAFRLHGDAAAGRLTVVSTAVLFADAIRRVVDGGSITELLAGN